MSNGTTSITSITIGESNISGRLPEEEKEIELRDLAQILSEENSSTTSNNDDITIKCDNSTQQMTTSEPVVTLLKEEGTRPSTVATSINELPYDTLEYIFEYLGRMDMLVVSSVNRYFNTVASSDHFWSNQIGKTTGLLNETEIETYNELTKDQTKANWKLWRLDNLFYTTIDETNKWREELTIKDEEEGLIMVPPPSPPPFKTIYAQSQREIRMLNRVYTIEYNIRIYSHPKLSDSFHTQSQTSWIGFFIVTVISLFIGMILVPLSMDEFIPNEIGTYYWLISWLSLGIIPIPYFYLMLLYHSHRFEYYPIWGKFRSGKAFMYGVEKYILFSSTWTWVPIIYLVAGLKYAVYSELPILSYIAIPGYFLAMVSYFCSAPSIEIE